MTNRAALPVHIEYDGSKEVLADIGGPSMAFPLTATDMIAESRQAFAWAQVLPPDPVA